MKGYQKGDSIDQTRLVRNGYLNFRGEIADKDKTGAWKSSPFILMSEIIERMAFYGVVVTMVSYVVVEMHDSLPKAAAIVNTWVGSAFFLTIVGAFLADAYLGRYKTILFLSGIYVVGMVLLTLSATVASLRPPPCEMGSISCLPATDKQRAFLYTALALIAMGTGTKPCVASFGADQFEEEDAEEAKNKYAFFNWFYLAVNVGIVMGLTLVVRLQVMKGWEMSFGFSTLAVVSSACIFAIGCPVYRNQRPMGSAFTRFSQVFVASIRNHLDGVKVAKEDELYEVKQKESDVFGARKLPHTKQLRFLDKAAVVTGRGSGADSRWRLCTVTQVEELKSMIRVLPVWATTIALYISFAQMGTFFISQAVIMNRQVGSYTFPSSTAPVFAALSPVILIPIYEGIIVPAFRRYTGRPRGVTSLQRIGVGLFLSIFAVAFAAVVEKRRREAAPTALLSVFWLFPQYFLMGTAEVFTYVGQLEFFYDEATDGTRSLSGALFLCEVGVGNWLSTALVNIVVGATGGESKGWLQNDLNHSRLDNFYWVLAAINAVNIVAYVVVACFHKEKEAVAAATVGEEATATGGSEAGTIVELTGKV